MIDAEWAVIEPLLPEPGWVRGLGGSPGSYCRRDIVNAIRYLTHNGPVWRALPAGLPHWRTVYGYVRAWQASGATRRMHDTLREQVRVLAGRGPAPTAAIIDSQSVKAADTVAKRQPRIRCGEENRGQEEAPRRRCDGPHLVRRGHRRLGPGPRRRPPAAVAAGRRVRAVTLIWADGGYAGKLVTWTGCAWRDTAAPLAGVYR